MGGSHSRTKGHSFERLIAIKLRETGLDPNARRNVQETQVASVDILTDLPLAIQCKCIANWSVSPHSVWNQANEGKLHPNDMPLGIVKITRKEPTLCIVSLDHMLEMLKKIYGTKETHRDS
jgi:hypothetical protein